MSPLLLYFTTLLFISNVGAWWEMDAVTGYTWDETQPAASSCSGSSPSGNCCPQFQEPSYPTLVKPSTVPDPYLTLSQVYAKIQIALPADNIDYSQTYLDDGTRNALCRPFYGSIFGYDTAGVGSNIGTARVIWGGTKGTCLRVLVNVPSGSFCWKTWHARVSPTTIALTGGSFPSFTANPSIWMTGTNPAACGQPVNITLCPDNPASGVTGTAVAPSPAAWTLPGCNAQMYLSFHIATLTSQTPPAVTDGWLVPQTQLGTSVSFDGTGTPTPYCPSSTCNTPFPTSYTLKSGTTTVGKLYVASNGNSLSYTFVPQTTSLAISSVRVYIGSSSTFANTFTYTYGQTVPVSPYQPVPYFTSTSFAVTFDLLRPIGGGGGYLVKCNTTYYTAFSVTVTQSSTTYTAQNTMVNAYKCCLPGALACATSTPCYPSLKFTDDLNWAVKGYEITTYRCCPLDQVLDVVLALLPEGVNNMNSGLTVQNVGGTCIYGPTGPGTPCTMGLTFLYEGAGYHNDFGYYFYDPNGNSGNGAVDTTLCNSASVPNNDPGLCTMFPDTSMINGGGCLNAGDTLMISVPAGHQLGWFLRANGSYQSGSWGSTNMPSKKSGDITNRNIWYSVINPPNGLKNSDGNDSLPPQAPTRHYGWLKIAGTVGNGFVVGVEDLANLGDHDFNDVVFGVKLNGNWSIPGLPSYDPCLGTLLTCKNFVPYDHAEYVYTPGCIPYITLDPGVGATTGKDPSNYYAIPPGWTIAPLNTLTVDTAKTFTTDFWISPCAVGVDPVTGAFQGYNAAGACPAGSSVTTITNPNDPSGGLCYNVGTAGHILIMAFQNLDPTCNANTYGAYCNPNQGSYYTVDTSSTPDYVYIVGLPGVRLDVPVKVPLYNRISIFTLIDTNGIVNSPNDANFQMKTVQYLFNNYNAAGYGVGYKAAYVGYAYTTTTSPYYVKACSLTSTQSIVQNTLICQQPSPAPSSASALAALTAILGTNAETFGWAPQTMRFIFVLTGRTTAYTASETNNFIAALKASGIYVVFLPTSTTAAGFLNTATGASASPNAVLVNINKPDPTSQPQAAALQWQQPALGAALPLAGRIEIVKTTSEAAGDTFATNIAPFTIAQMGKNPSYPDFQWYTVTPGTSITVPSNYPGGPSPMPKTITWDVLQSTDSGTGVPHRFATIISWNVGPNLPGGGVTKTFAFTDAVAGPYIAQWVDSIRSTLDPNRNLLDIVFESSTFSPSVPSTGWVQTATGYLGLDNNNAILPPNPIITGQRYNTLGLRITPLAGAYGTWTLTYHLTDGCLNSLPGTVVITFNRYLPPVCTSQSYSVPYGTAQTVDFTTLVTETPLLNGCQPASLVGVAGSTCPSAAFTSSQCTTCYRGTGCCLTAPAAGAANVGTCGASTPSVNNCPDNGSVLCNGGTCPTIGISCVALATCPTGQTCVGKIACTGGTGVGCPAGFQNGLYCLVNGGSTTQVCCSMIAASTLKIGFVNDLSASFGTVKYQSTPGTWSPVVYGANNANNAYLTDQFASLSGVSGTGVWQYVVNSPASGKNSNTCTISLTVGPQNRPPVISVSAMPVVTAPGSVGTYQVTISDPDAGDIEKMYVLYNGYTIQWNSITAGNFGVVSGQGLGPTTVLTQGQSATTPLLTNLMLSGSGNSITFNMQWQPTSSYPFGAISQFQVQAEDKLGAKSNLALVSLTVPAQAPPTCVMTVTGTRTQYDAPFQLQICGTSPNPQDQTSLDVTFVTLPNKGTISITKGAATQSIVVNTLYSFGQWGNAASPNTCFTIIYAPGLSSGADTFGVRFSSTNNQNSGATPAGNCVVNLFLTPKPTPPKTSDFNGNSVRNVNLNVPITGTSVDGTLITITITAIDLSTGASLKGPDGMAVTVGKSYMISPTSAGSWPFTYLNPTYAGTTQNGGGVDFFKYYVTDSNGLSSGSSGNGLPPLTSNTATITQPLVNQNPITNPGSTTTTQNTPVPITLSWGTPTSNYNDPDSSQAQQTLKITSFPATGTLVDVATGQPVPTTGPNAGLTSPNLIYTPAPNSVVPAQFKFMTTDNTGLPSNISPYDITISAAMVPPFITLVPTGIQIDRGTVGHFTITTWDINSNQIQVYVEGLPNVPFKCATPAMQGNLNAIQCSTISFGTGPVYGQASGNPTAFSSAPGSAPVLLTTIDNTGNWGKQWTIDVAWNPSLVYYSDSRTGSFGVYAQNQYGQSSHPVGNLAINPNIAPVAGGVSTISVTQTQTNAGPINTDLIGTDANAYHDPYLSFTLVTPPAASSGVTISQRGSTAPLAAGATFGPATGPTLSNNAKSSSPGPGTEAPMQLNFPQNFFGTVTYTFTTTDALGAVSQPKTVTVTVGHVNQPPATMDVTIVVKEASCVLASCGTPTPLVWASGPGTLPTIVGTDPDLIVVATETLKQAFASLPGPNLGTLIYNNAPLTSTNALPSSPTSPQWTVYYQPPSTLGVYNTDCTDSTNWMTCAAPFLQIPFKVTDSSGLFASANYNIYIEHVPHPPDTSNYGLTATFGVPLPWNIVGTSPDGTLKEIVFTSYTLAAPAMTVITGPDGQPLQLNVPYLISTGTGDGSSTAFPMTYLSSDPAMKTDLINYYVQDSVGGVSAVKTTTINMGVTLLPPIARGDSFTTNQDTSLPIPFVFGSATLTAGQHRYSSQDPAVSIEIRTLPAHGILVSPVTGKQVVIGTSSAIFSTPAGTDPIVTYIPNAGYYGSDQFDFRSLDKNSLFSSDVTDLITIPHVDAPPIITITPPSLTVPRGSPAKFAVTVSDVDSASIAVSATMVVSEWTSNNYGTLELYNPAGQLVGSWGPGQGPVIGQTLFTQTQTAAQYGNLWTYSLVWTPAYSAPDPTNGGITLTAFDGTKNNNGPNPSAVANIVPNLPPTATGTTTITVPQGTTSVPLDFPGTDPNPYHDKVLTITVTPPTDPTTPVSPISMQTVPVGTDGTATLTLPPDFPPGQVTITYIVTDLLGAPSPPATITVDVTPVNKPPTVTPPTIVVPQDSCMLSPTCTTPNTPQDLACSDPEGTPVYIVPSPPSLGTGGVLDPVTGNVIINTGSTVNGMCPYELHYQPPPGLISDCVAGFDPVTGAGCTPVTTIPITACDQAGLCVTTNVPVIVTPVNHPPVTSDIVATGRMYVFDVTGSDPDNNIKQLVIDSVNIADRTTTTLKFNQMDVVVGAVFNGDPADPHWPFVYVNNGIASESDSFTWHIVDDTMPTGLISNTGTGTITAPPVILVPSAFGDMYTTTPGATIPIALDYGPPDTGSNLWNPSGSESSTSTIITMIPPEGVLHPCNDPTIVVTEGYVVPPGVCLTYTAGPDGGSQSFQIQAYDPLTGTSTPATIQITVVPPPLPPVIEMTPDIITVDRGAEIPVFSVKAWAPSSDNFRVIFTQLDVPWGTAEVPISTKFDVRRPDSSVVQEWAIGNTPSVLDTADSFTYPTMSQWGTQMPFQISWTPSYFAPDTTTGSFSLQVIDGLGQVSNTVTGKLAVIPNVAPAVVDNPSGPTYYDKTFEQGGWTGTPITLRGADVNPWDCNKLKFQITSGPSNLVIAAGNDPEGVDPIRGGNLDTFSPVTSPVPGSCDTQATVNVIPTNPDWSGTDTFTFVTIDTFGVVSPPQTVTITVTPVPHPPTSQDVSIYTYQNACVFAYCGATPDIVAAMNNAIIPGHDIDAGEEATLTLVWEDLPPTGTLATYVPGSSADLQIFDTSPEPKTDGWTHQYWYQPDLDVTSQGCDKGSFNNCQPLTYAHFHWEDVTGLKSPTYTATIYVAPVNQPPYSQNLEFTINQGETLIIYFTDDKGVKHENLPAYDVDTPQDRLAAQFRGTAVGSRGAFTDNQGSTFGATSASNNAEIAGRYIVYTPGPTDVSDPLTDPVGTAYFRVHDDGPLYSPDYYIKIWIKPTPQPVEWVGPREITTFRRTPVLINLNIPQYWQTTDTKATPRFTLTGAPALGKFYVLDPTAPGGIRDITGFPTVIPDGKFFYLPPAKPLPDWGPMYIIFPFKLEMLDQDGNAHAISTVDIPFTVNVEWINDPPVLIPLWQPEKIPFANAFDEDTFIRFQFTGDDEDGLWPGGKLNMPRPNPILRGQVQTLPDLRYTKVFACDPVMHGPGGTGKKDCSDGQLLTPGDFLPTWNPPQSKRVNTWEVSVVGQPDVNGIFRLNFVVWDEDLAFSEQGTCVVNILPINDYPSIVKEKTWCDLVRYKAHTDNKPKTCYEEVSFAPKGTKITIKDGNALDAKLLQGEVINKPNSNPSGQKSSQAHATEDDDKLVLINKCTATLQDKDFTFGYNLNITGYLYQATFMNPLDLIDCKTEKSAAAPYASKKRAGGSEVKISQNNPKTGKTENVRMSYSSDVQTINEFLSTISFLVIIDSGVTTGFGLFKITDYGNIDKWNRPLDTTFTIEFAVPIPLAAAPVPIAVIALLPIVAAAVSAIAAGAWLMLGSRAADAVTENFDAFAPTQEGQGNLSPCYDDQGWHAENPMDKH